MIKLRKISGQSILEYSILVIVVAMAFISMHLYIRRAVNARLHNIELEINPGIIVENDPVTLGGGETDGK